MAIFKCKMCGGNLEFEEGLSITTCEYCGTQQTLPKFENDTTKSLFNRANSLRLKNEFDKAQEIYEKIISTGSTDAEAYWGNVLCKFGIEYVEDPKTFKRVPTCHRTQLESVLSDIDYKSAIENADESQKAIYEAEAKAIDELQKNILRIVDNEKSFDVFICYKETDEDGKRTQDSVLANEIYHQLTQEGLKVFYAAITLEDKLGQEYEPYIFSALNSAKVMLVIGTKPEYFNAVWVRNEWSRYLKIIKNDRKKLLIPCYKDMDAYDLPEEFSHLQAQDMSKIGFINDVTRGIKKLICGVDKQTVHETYAPNDSTSSNVTALLKRGYMAIEDGEWKKADDFFEQVLNQNAEFADAYLGKLLVEMRVQKVSDLVVKGDFGGSTNYQRTLKFCDEQLAKKLKGYLEKAREKDIHEPTYLSAIKIAEGFQNDDIDLEYRIRSIRDSIAKLESIGFYKDAQAKADEYKKHLQSLEEKATKQGCYVATAVYGSYDCPQVWTLRRYRDYTLAQTWYGRAFIRTYYAISPTLVKWFGYTEWFKKMWQGRLDKMVADLQEKGFESTPYEDKKW